MSGPLRLRPGFRAERRAIVTEAMVLLEDPRHKELVAALTQELGAPPRGRSVEARVLFQQDLWRRFDALHKVVADSGDEGAMARGQSLLSLLGRLIARNAPRLQEPGAIRSNFAEAARAYPGILDPGLFSSGSPWRELVRLLRSGEDTTAHATTARFRRIFRVFVRAPEALGGAACLETYFRSYYENWTDPSQAPCVRGGSVLS